MLSVKNEAVTDEVMREDFLNRISSPVILKANGLDPSDKATIEKLGSFIDVKSVTAYGNMFLDRQNHEDWQALAHYWLENRGVDFIESLLNVEDSSVDNDTFLFLAPLGLFSFMDDTHFERLANLSVEDHRAFVDWVIESSSADFEKELEAPVSHNVMRYWIPFAAAWSERYGDDLAASLDEFLDGRESDSDVPLSFALILATGAFSTEDKEEFGFIAPIDDMPVPDKEETGEESTQITLSDGKSVSIDEIKSKLAD